MQQKSVNSTIKILGHFSMQNEEENKVEETVIFYSA